MKVLKKGLVVAMMVVLMVVSVISPAFAASALRNVTFIVNSPYVADAQVYIAGSFNNWNPSATALQPYGYSYSGYSGQWIATIQLPEGQHQFKFTLGSNNTFEKGASFQEIANRTVTVGSTDISNTYTVENYNGIVNVEVAVPSDTYQKGSRVFLATSNKGWSATSYMMFPKQDGSSNVWSTKILLKSATSIQYKYTLGSWTTVEKAANGADIVNRSLSFNGTTVIKKDTIAKWN